MIKRLGKWFWKKVWRRITTYTVIGLFVLFGGITMCHSFIPSDPYKPGNWVHHAMSNNDCFIIDKGV